MHIHIDLRRIQLQIKHKRRVATVVEHIAIRLFHGMRDQAVTGDDWYPTILDLCNVELPKVKLDGQSIVPLIKSADAPTHHKVLHWHFQKRWAVRQGDWKLISAPQGAPGFLANLADEEPERRNYIKEKPEVVAGLLKLHNEWIF